MAKKEFDYAGAVAELEEIALKVENPDTAVGDIDGYVRRSAELVAACRDYLRGVRSGVDELFSDCD